MNWNSLIFRYCKRALRADFDVALALAFGAIPPPDDDDMDLLAWTGEWFPSVINGWGEFLEARVTTIRRRLEAHDEFMEFLPSIRLG